MAELQQENPDIWKVDKAKRDFEPGVYDQIIKEYPGIKIDPKPGKSAKPVISFGGKSIDFGIRIGVITLQEIREQFGEPVKEIQDTNRYTTGFSIDRIDTKALDKLDRIAKMIPSRAKDGTPSITVLLNDGYEATISTDIKGEQIWLGNQFKYPKDILRVEVYMESRSGGIPLILKSKLDDGTNEYITINRKR